MHPSWIIESYKVWLRGDDVDLREVSTYGIPWKRYLLHILSKSVARHTLPIFNSVVISLTGIPSIERRMEINKLVTKNGGVYVKNLERPIKVTHLICSREDSSAGDGVDRGDDAARNIHGPWVSDQSEKIIYAQKFNERGEANIHIVWEEWLWDCLAHGGKDIIPVCLGCH